MILFFLVPAIESTKIAAVVASDCTRSKQQREIGTVFPASLVALMHLKDKFPEWHSLLITDEGRWAKGCREIFDKMNDAYKKRYRGEIELISLKIGATPLLSKIQGRPGSESKHSKGHWPVEAYMHLLLPELLADRFAYTVVVDPDVYFLDSTLQEELSKVRAVGCISAIPAQCFLNPYSSGTMGQIHDEYRLIAYPDLRGKVQKVARNLGTDFHVTNTTNSGVVIYHNENLQKLNWSRWIDSIFDVSPLGFYGDQTALSVALGRDDIDVHWLHPRFNVALAQTKDYIRATCGVDARYSKHAAIDPLPNTVVNLVAPDTHRPPTKIIRTTTSQAISGVHFVWSPKPWTPNMNINHMFPLKFAVQADLPYANVYRTFVRRILDPDLLTFFAPRAFDHLNNASTYVKHAIYSACKLDPFPCGGPGPPSIEGPRR